VANDAAIARALDVEFNGPEIGPTADEHIALAVARQSETEQAWEVEQRRQGETPSVDSMAGDAQLALSFADIDAERAHRFAQDMSPEDASFVARDEKFALELLRSDELSMSGGHTVTG
jgi:hypothetical protein